MSSHSLVTVADSYLNQLCVDIPGRHVGSAGNLAATEFFVETAARFGFTVEKWPFECIDWQNNGATLMARDTSFDVFASPYSLGCHLSAPLMTIETVAQLETSNLKGHIVLLHGDIARHQLMPKNFPFYNPEEHQQIIRMLEDKQAKAIIAATGRDPEMVGSLYPFPLFEDGDFDIPSVYMTDVAGDSLRDYAGQRVTLVSRAHRIPSEGWQVVARKGDMAQRVVFFAHIDAKQGTPGALDNSAGIVTLLLLAQLLADYDGQLGIELVALNGEDYYATPGQKLYLNHNLGHFGEIQLGINIDGAGYHKGRIAYSLYQCDSTLSSGIEQTLAQHPELIAGDAWYQGDHGLFLMNGIPALAFTSEYLTEIMVDVVHTGLDTPGIINVQHLVSLSQALNDLILRLNATIQT